MTYSILDVETTGFSRNTDRIIEIAIIKINSDGVIIDTFESLINPGRDVGPTHIHGITATAVSNAPSFEKLADQLLSIIDGSIIVSHNKSFDLGFLNSEFQRSKIETQELTGICTLQLSKHLFPELPSRKLDVLCEYLDILVENAHHAMSDCKATMLLFSNMKKSFVAEFGQEAFKQTFVRDNLLILGRDPLSDRLEYRRIDADQANIREVSRLTSLLKRIPDFHRAGDYNVSEYLNLLDRILEDRIISPDEFSEIEKYAVTYKISSTDLANIHEEYFRRLLRFYLSDNVLSNSELLDLNKVGDLLQIDPSKRKLIVQLEKAEVLINADQEDQSVNIGKSVCFTGQLLCKYKDTLITRELAHSLAIEKGLVVKKGVTKSLDMLVVSDPNTQSGKAKKAKQYGVKILAEPVFWKKIGVKIK